MFDAIFTISDKVQYEINRRKKFKPVIDSITKSVHYITSNSGYLDSLQTVLEKDFLNNQFRIERLYKKLFPDKLKKQLLKYHELMREKYPNEFKQLENSKTEYFVNKYATITLGRFTYLITELLKKDNFRNNLFSSVYALTKYFKFLKPE